MPPLGVNLGVGIQAVILLWSVVAFVRPRCAGPCG